MRLYAGQASTRIAEIGVEILGSHAVASSDGQALDYGLSFLMRQAGSLGGGSTEMARNIISERVLGMPREFAADRDVPFSQVRQGR
jgi:alkylation response protein AidB-like acyl-CoA dehydrogenase